MAGALDGTRIIDLTTIFTGPICTSILGDQGADVIKVESPTGDWMRTAPGAQRNGVVGSFAMMNRNKRAISVDMASDGGSDIVRQLIATADVVVENYRPGVMERLGLGPDVCLERNPKLVYGRMTGWGQDGPKAKMAGHDLNYIATSGALWYAGLPGQPPLTPPTLVGDIGGGALYLVIGLLSGIMNARASGKGSVVDAAIVDGSAHMMNLLMAVGVSATRGQSLLDGPHWSRSYVCADGGFMSVQCLEPQFYAEFLRLMGLSEDPGFAQQNDVAQWSDQTNRLAAMFAAQPRDHWAALFEGTDACVAPVYSPHEAASDPHVAARAIWHRADNGRQAAPAPRFDGKQPRINTAPKRGQHTEEILADLNRG